MTQTEALKAAIDHIDRAIDEPNNTMSDGKALKEIMRQLNLARAALGEALAQPEQEPVAWVLHRELFWPYEYEVISEHGDNAIPLYTTPPKRNWVGLTDEVIDKVAAHLDDTTIGWSTHEFARAIEAKSKEKNHGNAKG